MWLRAPTSLQFGSHWISLALTFISETFRVFPVDTSEIHNFA